MLKRKWVIMGLCLIMVILVSTKECLSKEEFTISSKELIERLARLETRVEALDKRIDDVNKRIDDVNKRIDDLRNELKEDIGDLRTLTYVVLAGIIALIGFVIWDRRTAISPVVKKTRELEEEKELMFRVFREYARHDKKMEEVLKSLRLL